MVAAYRKHFYTKYICLSALGLSVLNFKEIIGCADHLNYLVLSIYKVLFVHILTLILPINFVLKMLSAFYICCIYSNALQSYFDHRTLIRLLLKEV